MGGASGTIRDGIGAGGRTASRGAELRWPRAGPAPGPAHPTDATPAARRASATATRNVIAPGSRA